MQILSELSDECKKCPYVDDCSNKRMVACAMKELDSNIVNNMMPSIGEQPITINVDEYNNINTVFEKIAEKLKEESCESFYCSFNR